MLSATIRSHSSLIYSLSLTTLRNCTLVRIRDTTRALNDKCLTENCCYLPRSDKSLHRRLYSSSAAVHPFSDCTESPHLLPLSSGKTKMSEEVSEAMQIKGFQLCKEFLGGSWNKLSRKEFKMQHIR